MMRLKAEKDFFPQWWIGNKNWAPFFFLFTCFILHYLCLCLCQCILCVGYPFLIFFFPLVLNSKIIINPDCVGLSAVLFFTRCIFFPWRLCGKLRKFYNRISICCISDSVFGATIFHPRIDKLFSVEVWISPFLSLSLSFPDVSLQLPWLTANSFITGHKHQVLHLKGHPTPNSRTSEKSTCKNSIQGTPFH